MSAPQMNVKELRKVLSALNKNVEVVVACENAESSCVHRLSTFTVTEQIAGEPALVMFQFKDYVSRNDDYENEVEDDD